MATQFAYVPSTNDGCTIRSREPQSIPVVVEEEPWPWRVGQELSAEAPVEEGELVAAGPA